MNVGLVVPGFSADADDWCIPALRDLARCLATRTSVRLITLRYPYRAARYAIEGAEVIALGGAEARGVASLRLWQHTLSTLTAEHRRRRFDVLHGFWATESGFLAALAGRLLRIPTLVSLAGGELVALPSIGYGDQRVAWEQFKVRNALRLATVVSAGSDNLVARAQPYAKTLKKLPLGVDTDRFKPAVRKTEHGALRVLHVGTLTPVKDQATLLQAFASLRLRQPRARLEIVGDGPMRPSLERTATSLGLDTSVQFVGAVDHGDLVRHYQNADVFALSSKYEAQGMVALEASACGLPVVGTSVGVVPEIGRAVPVGDAAALADAMACPPVGDSNLPAEFELRRCVDRFLDVYQALVA